MSMDGVVPPPGGPTRRPAGGPADEPGRAAPTGPVPPPAAGRRPGAPAWSVPARPATPSPAGDPAPVDGPARDNAVLEDPAFDNTVLNNTVLNNTVLNNAAPGNTAPDDGASGHPRLNGSDLFDAGHLAAALRSRVAPIGAAGPPAGGLARVRRRARIRQRNRAALAGSAGVLVIAVAVTLATGDRFNIVPTLTGTSGNNSGAVAGGQTGGTGGDHGSAAAANGGRVVWPKGGTGKTGPAIGPVAPVTSTPSAAAAARVPLCTAGTLVITTTVGPTVGGVVYGHVDAVAQVPCVVVGPPVLAVANAAGTAADSVLILKENTKVAGALPQVATWGTTMVLNAGDSYQFQFAWATAQCPQTSGSAAPSGSAARSATTYTLGYAVTGTTPTAPVTLTAACGADVFVTDIYKPGAYPLPSSATQSPVPTTSASPVTTTAPPNPPTSTAPPGSTTPSPSVPPSTGATGGNGTNAVVASPSG